VAPENGGRPAKIKVGPGPLERTGADRSAPNLQASSSY
jgi:hypothetical protein